MKQRFVLNPEPLNLEHSKLIPETKSLIPEITPRKGDLIFSELMEAVRTGNYGSVFRVGREPEKEPVPGTLAPWPPNHKPSALNPDSRL